MRRRQIPLWRGPQVYMRQMTLFNPTTIMVRKTKGRRRNGRRTRKNRRGGFTEKPVQIIRFWMNGCGACQASEAAWTKFENETDPDGIKKVKIERDAIPVEWDQEVQAFPTYIVVVDGKKVAKETGANTDLGKLKEVAVKASKKNKRR